MKRSRLIGLLVIGLLVVACLFFASIALARPGGGQAFSHGSSASPSSQGSGSSSQGSGSSRHGSSSSSSGSDAFIGLLIDILWQLLPWQVKLAVVGAILIAALVQTIRSRQHNDWSSSSSVTGPVTIEPAVMAPPSPSAPAHDARHELAKLRTVDPAFSIVLFEDFLYALYPEVRRAVGKGEIDTLAPYLSADVLAKLKAEPHAEVSAVIVGGMLVTRVRGDGPNVIVTVELDVNVGVVEPGGEANLYRVEAWSLTRRADARSRAPARARVIDCPGCGAPLSAVIAGVCSHCKQVVATADLDWRVTRVEVRKEERLPPMLTSDVAQEAANLPLVADPERGIALEALRARDPTFEWSAFDKRVELVFGEFQVAWSAQNLARMRPFLSDNLFQTQEYWIDAYRKQKLRNVTENARIEGTELSRMDSDASFDTITVRVRATGLDYTLAEGAARVVAGSRERERAYAEYWTFIRGAGRTGVPTRTEAVCPSCGAPLEINMAGVCTYCQAKVTSGEFDWVLSRIEQPEAYRA